MSTYVTRFYEVRINDIWTPVRNEDGEIVKITDGLCSCRNVLVNNATNLPKDLSVDLSNLIKGIPPLTYKYMHSFGYLTLEDLEDLEDKAENNLVEIITRTCGNFDPNYRDYSDRCLLETLYVNSVKDIKSIYSENCWEVYGLTKLIGEAYGVVSSKYSTSTFETDIRLIYYMQ